MRRSFALMLACSATGCGQRSGQLARAAREQKATRAATEDDVREAVLRYEFEHFAVNMGFDVPVYYLSSVRPRNPYDGRSSPLPALRGRDPYDGFIRRFEGHDPPVERSSLCTDEGRWDIVDKVTGERGCVFWTGSITWRTSVEAELDGGHDMGRRHAAEYRYSIIRERGRWLVREARVMRARGSLP